MSNFSVFDIMNTEVIDHLHKALWDKLVPSNGACESLQGELIRTMGRISSEMFRNMNNNWIYGKYEVNQDGYPKGYMPEWEDENYNTFIPDISKCNATQEQLDNATLYDELLNDTKSWLQDHPLDEWDQKFQQKLQDTLETARPTVPLGVVSDGHWEIFDKEHGTVGTDGWSNYDDENSNFVNAQIVYWIYRNPDLIDISNTPLNKSIETIFKNYTEEV
jgi:hypothetical protein